MAVTRLKRKDRKNKTVSSVMGDPFPIVTSDMQLDKISKLMSKQVPAVLLSGNHQEIAKWRLKQSLGRTWLRRPDLLYNLALTEEQTELLAEFQQEHNSVCG